MSAGRRWTVALALAGLGIASGGFSDGASAQPSAITGGTGDLATRPRLALVLSGGGARGGAHLGVLRVLEEMQVPIDMVVGTSAGAIIGAAYASGMSVAEIEAALRPLTTAQLVRDVTRADLPLRDKSQDAANFIGPEVGLGAQGLALPIAAVAGVALEAVLRNLTVRQRHTDFDRLPVPFRAVATDLASADMVVLGSGSLVTAIRASMALPAIVTPVALDGRVLVDGGLARNLPVDVARAMGADVVIAVNIGSPLHTQRELTSLLSVTDQMVRMLTVRNTAQSLREIGPQDVLVVPQLGDITTSEFDRLLEAAQAGEAATRAVAAQLQRFAVDADSFAALERERTAPQPATRRIAEVRVTGAERVNPETVRAAMDLQAGQLFEPARADAGLKRLYARGDFSGVSYALSDEVGVGHVLTTAVTEKPWGPHYLRFGLGLSSDFSGNSYFNLLLQHRRTWLNRLGGEWRNELQFGRIDSLRTELHQPLDSAQRWFTAVHAETRREPFDLYIDEVRVARYRRRESLLGADIGVALGGAAELRAGIVRGRVTLADDTGFIPARLLTAPQNVGGALARLRIDTLDSLRFPRHGWAMDLRYFHAMPGLGAQARYGKLDLLARGAVSFGPNTLRAAFFAARSVGGNELPLFELSQLGGFQRLSGYHPGELLGTDMRFGRLVFARRVDTPGLLEGVEIGVTAEVGRVSAQGLSSTGTARSNALFMGVDTPIGPLYLGYGIARGGRHAVYLFLGVP